VVQSTIGTAAWLGNEGSKEEGGSTWQLHGRHQHQETEHQTYLDSLKISAPAEQIVAEHDAEHQTNLIVVEHDAEHQTYLDSAIEEQNRSC
jgi:hypothetical protein